MVLWFLGSPSDWGISSAAPAPVSCAWFPRWGAAPNLGKVLVEVSIQPSASVSEVPESTQVPCSHCKMPQQGRTNFWTSLLCFFEILGFSLWRSWWKGKGYWRLLQLNLLEHQDCWKKVSVESNQWFLMQGVFFLQSMPCSDQRPENTSKATWDSIQSNNCRLSRQEVRTLEPCKKAAVTTLPNTLAEIFKLFFFNFRVCYSWCSRNKIILSS